MTAVLGGELYHIINETGEMSEPEAQFYAANLVVALQHLHSRGIAYRDLKTENVLLSGGFTHAAAGWPVLADFGLANWLKNDGSRLQTFCGTPEFIAPEVASQNGHGAAADWWSLGVLIHQCLTICTPFEGPTAHATIENVIHGRRVPPANPEILSETATSIIDALLQPDPEERLGGTLRANEVRTHPFFWGFDFTQIEKRQMTPPHAARCRERAIAATQHPSLCLPPLPELEDNLHGSSAALRTTHNDDAPVPGPAPVPVPAPVPRTAQEAGASALRLSGHLALSTEGFLEDDDALSTASASTWRQPWRPPGETVMVMRQAANTPPQSPPGSSVPVRLPLPQPVAAAVEADAVDVPLWRSIDMAQQQVAVTAQADVGVGGAEQEQTLAIDPINGLVDGDELSLAGGATSIAGVTEAAWERVEQTDTVMVMRHASQPRTPVRTRDT